MDRKTILRDLARARERVAQVERNLSSASKWKSSAPRRPWPTIRKSPTSMPRRAPRCSISARRPLKSGARSPATPRGRTTRRRRRCPRSSSSSPKVSRCPDVRRDIAVAHGLDLVETEQTAAPAASAADRVIAVVNDFVVRVSSFALIAAGLVLTYSVIVRYFLKISTDWQDEMSVVLIVGAGLMSSAGGQG